MTGRVFALRRRDWLVVPSDGRVGCWSELSELRLVGFAIASPRVGRVMAFLFSAIRQALGMKRALEGMEIQQFMFKAGLLFPEVLR